LLLEYDIGKTDKEEINGDYVAKLLSTEWGFYHTVTLNLPKIKQFMDKYPTLTAEDKKVVSERIDKLQAIIEGTPKTLQWKLRAKIGPAKKWYNAVEEVQRD